MTRIIQNLADVSDKYAAVFCDLWGCVHNGVEPFPEGVKALQEYRTRGGVRGAGYQRPHATGASVEKHLSNMGLARDSWDVIASSGDSARAAMYRGSGRVECLVHGRKT